MGEPANGVHAAAQWVLRATVDPLTRAAATLARPVTYTSQLREAAAAAATVGLWPLGLGAPPVVADHRSTSSSPSPKATVVPGTTSDDGQDDLPVLLVHGYGANRSNWHFVDRRLRAAGFGPIHAVNYNPLTSDLPSLAAWLVDEVASLRERLGCDTVHVVGHSLGGVVARYAIQVLGAAGVATCVTLASPHGGVAIARGVRPLPGGLGAVARQLRPDSPEMVLLRSSARPLATRFVAFAAGSDLIVPASRAVIREPELHPTNLVVAHHGHFSLLFSPALANALVHQLRLPRQSAAATLDLPAAA